MHILGLILGILVAISVWSWRIRAARQGLNEAANLAQTAKNLPRRVAFRYRANKSGLDLIQDPREAAAIIMMEIARARGGAVTETQTHVLTSEIQHYFQLSPDDAAELIEHATWVTDSAPAPNTTLRKLSQTIVNAPQIGPKEIVDLDAMLVAISEAEGVPTRDQLALLQIYRDRVGLKT